MRSIRGKPYDISRKHMTIVDNRGGRSPELRRREKDRPPFFEKQRGTFYGKAKTYGNS
jgi:hypothetical protein